MTGRARLGGGSPAGMGGRAWVAVAATLSFLVHAAVLYALLPHASGRPVAEVPAVVEIEMVDQLEAAQGAAPTPPPAPDAAPTPRPAPPTPAVADSGGDLAPPTPQTPPRPESAPAPAVHLGGADEDRESLLVTGDTVVPPRPDAAFHNRPPDYPAAAGRRGVQGTVLLLIHVSEAGIPAGVEVLGSSGDASLDRAARDAAALWRFQPARNKGVAVPFDYQLNIRFTR